MWLHLSNADRRANYTRIKGRDQSSSAPLHHRKNVCARNYFFSDAVQFRTTFIGVLVTVFKWKRTSRETIAKSFSLEVFHHEKIHTVLMADIVERADMLMIERGDRLCFAFEPLSQFRVGCVFGKNLDGNRSIQPRVSRPVHLTHPTGADRREDFVRTKQLSGLKRHWHGNLYQIRDAVTHLGGHVKV
jgi:hypothetical protein